MFAKTILLSLAASAAAVDLTLFTGNNFECLDGISRALICTGAPPTACCGDPAQRFEINQPRERQSENDWGTNNRNRYSSVRYTGLRSSDTGFIWAPSRSSSSCGQVLEFANSPVCLNSRRELGGITGATWDIDTGMKVRRGEDAGNGDCVLPDVVQIADGSKFAINGDVPREITLAMYKKIDEGATTAADMAEFEEYAL